MDGRTITLLVGRNIYNARKNRGLSQKDVYIASGIAQSTLSKMEAGSHTITIDALVAIAAGIDAPLTEFLVDLPTMDKVDTEAKILKKYRTDSKFKAVADAML